MYMIRGLYILTEKEREKRKQAHRNRLNKIKKREYGSSVTLDNNPPKLVLALITNPRKNALKVEFHEQVKQRNRIIKKRLESIKTSPTKITDKDYIRMKKLCNSLKERESYDNIIAEKYNKKFFEQLKKVGPYYKREIWEEDYQRQKISQRFMRQVHYERKDDYLDPLFIDSGPYYSRNKTATCSNHVSSIRNLKLTRSAESLIYERPNLEYDGSQTRSQPQLGFRPESRSTNLRINRQSHIDSMMTLFSKKPAFFVENQYNDEEWDEVNHNNFDDIHNFHEFGSSSFQFFHKAKVINSTNEESLVDCDIEFLFSEDSQLLQLTVKMKNNETFEGIICKSEAKIHPNYIIDISDVITRRNFLLKCQENLTIKEENGRYFMHLKDLDQLFEKITDITNRVKNHRLILLENSQLNISMSLYGCVRVSSSPDLQQMLVDVKVLQDVDSNNTIQISSIKSGYMISQSFDIPERFRRELISFDILENHFAASVIIEHEIVSTGEVLRLKLSI